MNEPHNNNQNSRFFSHWSEAYVHGQPPDSGPAVPLHLALVVGMPHLQHRPVDPFTTCDHTHINTAGQLHRLQRKANQKDITGMFQAGLH